MARNRTNNTLTILAAGVTQTFPITDAVDIYDIKANAGAVVLVGNVSITSSGTLSIGSTYSLLIGGGFTLGANTFTVFGATLTAAQVLYAGKVLAYYNGSSWDVYYDRDDTSGNVSIQGGDIVAATVTSTALAGGIVNTKLLAMAARGYMPRGGANGVWESVDAKTTGQFVGGNGTDVGPLTMSGDATLASGVITVAANAITTAKVLDANITLAKLESKLLIDTIVVDASFESGEVGAGYKIKMNYAGTIGDIYVVATKALAATDAGTVTIKNNAGTTMTVTTPISFAASDAIGTAYTSAVTANNTFVVGDILTITTAKTTVGGKVKISLKSTRT